MKIKSTVFILGLLNAHVLFANYGFGHRHLHNYQHYYNGNHSLNRPSPLNLTPGLARVNVVPTYNLQYLNPSSRSASAAATLPARKTLRCTTVKMLDSLTRQNLDAKILITGTIEPLDNEAGLISDLIIDDNGSELSRAVRISPASLYAKGNLKGYERFDFAATPGNRAQAKALILYLPLNYLNQRLVYGYIYTRQSVLQYQSGTVTCAVN